MLPVPLLRGRIIPQICAGNSVLYGRSYTNGRNGRGPPKGRSKRKESEEAVKSDREEGATGKETEKNMEPSLFEQLFPDQHEADKKKQRESEIPRLPIETEVPDRPKFSREEARKAHDVNRSRPLSPSRQLRQEMIAQGAQTTVLVLRNASKNLVEEDFKRLIPQGKHLEGWRLEQGDILRVIPGRDLSTLAQENYYYILFSSALSAFTYQGHATRIHRMVAAHTPSSMLSPIPPPPGYMVEGMDAHAVIESFSLTPPTQSLDLRQLKPPLSPMMDSVVRHSGYAAVVNRKDRMPYEARLTLEGPQLHISAIRHILLASGRDRGLGWSGGDDLAPRLTRWEPLPLREAPSPMRKTSTAQKHTLAQESKTKVEESTSADASKPQTHEQKRRTPQSVYIAGFHTEGAMQSFVRFWHRRPIDWETGQRSGIEEGDLPPIANVEVLW